MSEQSKFVNVYIENCIALIHEYTSQILQLKTQVRIANDHITEQDSIIGQLTNDLQSARTENLEMENLRETASRWEGEYNQANNKLSHMNTLMAQLTTMKIDIQERDAKIAELEEKLNRKNKVKPRSEPVLDEVIINTTEEPKKMTDDF